ncbi:MAG: hypothetical protein JW888_06385 [Pirellulales bacterium]|nr:hypothetical protein [Pirellulales bacterium]
MSKRCLFCALPVIVLFAFATQGHGSGLLPKREHQVTIWAQSAEPEPSFLLIFSTKPLLDSRDRLRTMIKTTDLLRLEASVECVPIRVYGKRATKRGQYDYYFGPGKDADMPWNNGEDFRWQDWENFSPDAWDCLAITTPPSKKRSDRASCEIHNVLIKRNGQLLYDSRARASRPRQMPIDVSFAPTAVQSRGFAHPVLNLAEHMVQFRNDYYELRGNPILTRVFVDLGQSGFRKYVGPKAADDCQWCSEFVAHVFRQCGLTAPSPEKGKLGYGAIKKFCQRNGAVYPAREVASWPDEKKKRLIPPGSYISVVGNTGLTHSLLFMDWIEEPGKPITQYTAVSGNRRKMVWMDWALKLPDEDKLEKLDPAKIADLDNRAIFGVPKQAFALAAAGRAETRHAKHLPNKRKSRSDDKTASKEKTSKPSDDKLASRRASSRRHKSSAPDPSRQAEQALRMAEMLFYAGKANAAKKRFERIVAKYPDTPWAEKSKGYLEDQE